jgi:uncharacterized membrane protein SpoIIM required for sporulation
MRETGFIKQNKDKWAAFEKILEHKDKDPDQLNELFVQITDDLSYSRTFYPNRSVRVYLNNLAQQIFYSIYKSKKSNSSRLLSFWTDELPQLVYAARKELQLSFLLFMLAFGIGALSSAMDPDFPRIILGDSYVDMTIENIESGDPMAVYKQKGAFGMSLGITANNLFVAFLTFVFGALYAIGTAAVMVSNGVMVGAFQYFFYEKGVFLESFLTIWTHGTLEISAIIIAGAAGFTMGKGLVFPGTLTRMQSFQISARRGLKIMIGIAPIIVMAGFIEGFLTRFTETPDIIRGLFILICLIFVLGYYVWYPWMLARNGFKSPIKDTRIPAEYEQSLHFDHIKGAGEIFSDIFLCFRKYSSNIMLTVIAAAAIFCVLAFTLAIGEIVELFQFPGQLFGAVGVLDQFFVHEHIPLLPVINVLIYSLLMLVTFTCLSKETTSYLTKGITRYDGRFYLMAYVKLLAITGILHLFFILNDWFVPLVYIFVGPLIFLWAFIAFYENKNLFNSFAKMGQLVSGNYVRPWGLFIMLTTLGLLFYSILDSSILWFFVDVIGWNISMEADGKEKLVAILLTFMAMVILLLVVAVWLLGIGLLYFTLVEIKEAPSLKEKIKSIGLGKNIQGIASEI